MNKGPQEKKPVYAGYEALAAAIIEKAAKDYLEYSEKRRKPIRNFFLSEYFEAISNLDGKAFLEKLDKLIEK